MSGSNSSNPFDSARAAEPLQMSVHAMPGLDLSSGSMQRRARGGRWQLLLVVLACAAPVIASYFTYYVIRPESRSNYAALIDPAPVMPATLPLRDLDGNAVPAQTLHGQWLLVAVGKGDCESACEKRLYVQRQLREMTGRERDRIDKLWLVIDDAPIKPELRAALAAAPAAQVLRVPATELAHWLAPAPGESLESHLYLVDPMGRWMMRAPAQLDPSRFKRDVERVLRASASWDTPGR
jgi:hypothetical protein